MLDINNCGWIRDLREGEEGERDLNLCIQQNI